jgi:hypothetical protein
MTDEINIDMEMKDEYDSLSIAWITNENYIDIYKLIIDWIKKYEKFIKSQHIVKDIYKRIEDNDLIEKIVEDFMYEKKYEDIRNEMK